MLAPTLRDAFALTLAQVGVVLASIWVGATVTLLPWGLAADRVGERAVLAAGLALCALALAGSAFASGFGALVALLALAGAAGASVNAASGRAVMHWFGRDERGLALGLRQTALPLGGVLAALSLPAVAAAGGVRAALLFLAALCLGGAAVGGAVLRERAHEGVEAGALRATLAEPRLWRLGAGSGLYLVAQVAVTGFLVLFLHDARRFSPAAAAGVLAAVQVLAVALRVGAGRWSDVLGARVLPLRRIGLAIAATLALSAALVPAPALVLVPALVAAGALSMAWNGLSFTAAAELAGHARSGAALGFQQTVLSVVGSLVPPAFAALVEAVSWQAAFAAAALAPLVGWRLLRPLSER